jgi:hypothetical protein
MWSSNKIDSYNKNGHRLCDAYGCRKHKRLTACHRGHFCEVHQAELELIRSNISFYKSLESDTKTLDQTKEELHYREQELLLRKQMDKGHVRYILHLMGENVNC